jgi:hypothetical protein
MRKTLPLAACCAALLTLSLSGCDAAGPSADAALSASAAPAAMSQAGPAARGSGHLTVDDAYRTFSFNARVSKTGDSQGGFSLQARHQGIKIKGEVLCLRVVNGNEAYVFGKITEHPDTSFLEYEFGFRVVDNGEGSSESPDEITLVTTNFLPGASAAVCAGADPSGVLTALRPIENGNVQVQP